MFEPIKIKLPTVSLPTGSASLIIQDPYLYNGSIVFRKGDGRVIEITSDTDFPEGLIGRAIVKSPSDNIRDTDSYLNKPLEYVNKKLLKLHIRPEESINFPLSRSITNLILTIGIGLPESGLSEEYNYKLVLIGNKINSLY